MKGMTVNLFEVKEIGTDPFGAPIYKETPVEVADVLIGEPTTDDVDTSTALYSKKIAFMLGIPKGDTHDWVDKKVSWVSCGHEYIVRTFGYPITGVEANIPTRWHMKVRCEMYG